MLLLTRIGAFFAMLLVLMGQQTLAGFAQKEFSFDREYSYVDETRILHLLGKVTNESGDPITDLVVSAEFLDSDGHLLGEFKRPAELQSLADGESSSFEILFLDQAASDRVTNYSLSATAESSDVVKEKKFEITSSNSRLDLLGTIYINAAARNTGSQTATNSIMISTLYDRDGRVIAIGRALAEAVRGTADVPSNSEAAFGIAVTDKLQTYKATQYSLVVQSDQYVSDEVLFRLSGQGSSGGNQTQSGCLIATAAFGSEFAPQVQQLREFRDEIALQTFAGSGFMGAFNSWYYSFSPSVAEYERQSPLALDAVRIMVQPLLLILSAGTSLHDILSTSGMDAEAAIAVTGMVAGSLIGLVYLFPAAVLVGIIKRRLLDSRIVRIVLALSWLVSLTLVGTAAAWTLYGVMAVGTSALVLCSIFSAALFVSDRLSRL